MEEESLYIISYDIADSKRWRKLYRALQAAGDWLQLSIFQCRMNQARKKQLEIELRKIIKPGEDHVLIINAGKANNASDKIESYGKDFHGIKREPVII